MLILGRTNDDKGTQLEELTRRLLRALGYQNVITNWVGSGGEEIDVRAEYPLPGLGGPSIVGLICECKAYRAPLAMPEWLKFLGKVFAEDTREGQQTRACLIALNGVNGNVAGHHRDLARRRPNLGLLTGDALLEAVRSLLDVCDQEVVRTVVRDYTVRAVRSTEILYYDGAAYWAVFLEGDVLALLRHDGGPVSDRELDRLDPLVRDALPISDVLDLLAEESARRLELAAEKLVLSAILSSGGVTTSPSVTASRNLSAADIMRAVGVLKARGWIAEGSAPNELRLTGEDQTDIYDVLIAVDRFLLAGDIPPFVIDALCSPFHQEHLDETYVGRLQVLQGNISLSADEVVEVQRVLRWSPAALRWMLEPDPIMVNSVRQLESAGDFSGSTRGRIDRTRRRHLFRALYTRLARDYKQVAMRRHFLEEFGLYELQTTTTIVAKSRTGILARRELDERLLIGQLEPDLVGPEGSSYIIMQALDGTPEPWDPPSGDVTSPPSSDAR